jgi:hypothetical protein
MPVYTQENIAFNFNSGYVGFGENFPKDGNYNSGINLTLLNFGIEHIPTNIGFEFSPYKDYIWTGSGEIGNGNNLNHSFLNLNLYWNAFTILEGFFYFGAFAYVNYLFVGENVYWDKYVFTAGGRIGLRISFSRLNYNILSAEMGYRNIDGTSKYFIGIKVDALSFLLFIIYAAVNSEDSSSNSK